MKTIFQTLCMLESSKMFKQNLFVETTRG